MLAVWKSNNTDSFMYLQRGGFYNWLSSSFFKKDGASITRIITLSAGDKIKMRGRMIQGSFAQTGAHTTRLRIRKV